MPLYEFENVETGERVEHFFEVKDAPEIGAQVAVGTALVRRLPPSARIQPIFDRHFSSSALPRWWPYHDRHDKKTGKCLFNSQREVDEALARANHHGECAIYDDPGI